MVEANDDIVGRRLGLVHEVQDWVGFLMGSSGQKRPALE